jgi:hypothetical protein
MIKKLRAIMSKQVANMGSIYELIERETLTEDDKIELRELKEELLGLIYVIEEQCRR